MLKLLVVLAIGFTAQGVLANCASDSSSRQGCAVETVKEVNLARYVGKWYEVASIPQSFQKQCVKNTTAEYTALENGKIKVINSCEKSNGDRSIAEGQAKVVDKKTNSKLKVTFVKLGAWIYTFGGNYWVIALGENYDYAVVGDPSRDYAWILSRTPSLSAQNLTDAMQALKTQGYDLCKVLTSVQTGGFTERKPLCQL